MNAWLTLLYKDYRMNRTTILIKLGFILIGGLWLMYLSQRYRPGLILLPASLLMIIALFYPALFMLKNVSKELKHTPHLWLHCPQPAWMLLSSKLALGLAYAIVILLLIAISVYWVLFSSYLPDLDGITTGNLASIISEAGAYMALFIFAASIYLASWATLIAVVSTAFRHILGRFHKLAALIALIAATWGMGRLTETWLYEKITHWGALNISLQSVKDLPFPSHIHIPHLQVYSGTIVFYLLLTTALFALSAWLINNKVEV